MKKQKTIVSAFLLLIGLIIVFGVALLLQKGNFNDQSRASTGTVMLGKLITVTDRSCTKCVEQCPGADNVLRNCHPMESDGTSMESTCNVAGRIEFCGTKSFCCPSPGGKWTTDLTKCPGGAPKVMTPVSYRLLKDGGVCTSIIVSKTLADPLVGKKVIATGSLEEPYFYATELVQNTCVQQCPGKDNVLRNCTPPEADGTSEDSTCNVAGRSASCGGTQFCCPKPGAKWTKDMAQCPTTSTTPTKTPTPTPFPTTVTNTPPTVSTASLPTGNVGRTYSAAVTANDPNKTDRLNITFFGLPAGLVPGPCGGAVNSGQITCYISGTPTTAGYYKVGITATDDHGGATSTSLPLSIVSVVRQ